MGKYFALAAFVLLLLLASLLVGIAAQGRLPGYSWTQQYELYSVLIGAIVGVVLAAAAVAMVQNHFERRQRRK